MADIDRIPTRAEIEIVRIRDEKCMVALSDPTWDTEGDRSQAWRDVHTLLVRLDEAERLLDRLLGAHENEQYPPSIHGEVRRFLDDG